MFDFVDLARLRQTCTKTAKPNHFQHHPRRDVFFVFFLHPFARLRRFDAFSPKPNRVKPNATQPASGFCICRKVATLSPYN